MASDKEGDRSLSGNSGDREGTGGGPGGPAGTGRNSGTNSNSGGFSGGGTQSGPGGNQSNSGGGGAPSGGGGGGGGGGTASGSGSNAGGREGTGGGPGGPAGTGRNSGTNAGTGGGGTATGGMVATNRGATSTAPTRSVTSVPSMGGMVATGLGTAAGLAPAATATGFIPDFNRRPDLNPTIVANAALQTALARTRAQEHLPGLDPYSPSLYSTVFGGKVVPGLTNISLRQVMAFQRTMPRSRAVGAYQIKDLAAAAKLAGISLDAKFSIQTQDRLAQALADRRLSLATRPDGTVDLDKFAAELGKEWTSYAISTGRSAAPQNNKARGTYQDTRQVAGLFAQGLTAAPTATSATVPAANVPVPTARPTGSAVLNRPTATATSTFPTRPDVPVGALPAARVDRVMSKYLGAGRPMGAVPAPAAQPTSAAAQAVINDLRQRDAEQGLGPSAGGAGPSGVTPMSAGVNYAGTTPPSQALAPGSVGAGFSSAISPTQPSQALAPGTVGAGLSGQTPKSFAASVDRFVADQPSQTLAPGPIGAGFSSAIAPSIAALGSTPEPIGPPLTSLTNRAIAGTLAGPPAPDTFKRDIGARTVLRSADEAALHTVPNLAEAPKAKVTYNPGVVKPTSDIVDRIAASVAAAAPPGYSVNVRSGYRTKGGYGRHPAMRAGDFEIRDENGRVLSYRNPADREIMERVALTAARNYGVLGFGAGENYMGATAMHFDVAKTSDIGPNQDQEWSHMKGKTGEGFNDNPMHDELAQARADYAARAAGGTGSTPGQPAGFSGFTNAPAGSPAPAPPTGGAYPPAPGGTGDAGLVAGTPGATTAATTATTATTPRPAGTGPATGPWGDAIPDPVGPGPRAPEPLTPLQQGASWLTKIGLSVFGGVPGAVATGVDLLAETATGQGPIDRFWASTDNPGGGTGPDAHGRGDYAGSAEHGPTVGATDAAKRILDKYLTPQKPTTPTPPAVDQEPTYAEDTTWRPTPTQLWGPVQNKYSEFKYATP